MPALRRFYLVFDPDKKCCCYRFFKYVERVMEFAENPFPVEIDVNAGYILVDSGREVDRKFFDGFDWVWKLVEEKNFDKAKLVIKISSEGCDECRRQHNR